MKTKKYLTLTLTATLAVLLLNACTKPNEVSNQPTITPQITNTSSDTNENTIPTENPKEETKSGFVYEVLAKTGEENISSNPVIGILSKNGEVSNKDANGKIVSKLKLPDSCSDQSIPGSVKINYTGYSRLLCSDGFTYFFDTKQIVFKTNALKSEDSALLSQDLNYLAYLTDKEASQPQGGDEASQYLVIRDLQKNSEKYFSLATPTSSDVVEMGKDLPSSTGSLSGSLYSKVNADCLYYGPFPAQFDNQENNLFVATTCVDGAGTLQRIDLKDFSVTSLDLFNMSILSSSKDGNEYYYYFNDYADGKKLTTGEMRIHNKLTGKLVKTVKIDSGVEYTSVDWAYPLVGVTSNGKYALFNSFMFECSYDSEADGSGCNKDMEKFIIVDTESGKTINEIKKEKPYNYDYTYLYSSNSQIIYLERHSEKSRIQSFDINTKTTKTIYTLSEGEELFKVE